MLILSACASGSATPVAAPAVTLMPQPTLPPSSTPFVATQVPAPTQAPPATPASTVVAATSVTSTTNPAPDAANAPPQVTVTNDFVNVRTGPDTGYELLGKLDKGQQATVTGHNSDSSWWQIQFEGKRGWVTGQYVSANPAAGKTAVAEAPVLPTQPPVPTSPPAQIIELQPIAPTITPVPLNLAPTAPPVPVDTCNESDPNWRGKGQPSYQFCVRQDLEWANGDTKSQRIELYWDVYGVQSIELRIEGGDRGGKRVPVPNAGRFGINKSEYGGCFKAELYITRRDGQVVGYNEKFFCA